MAISWTSTKRQDLGFSALTLLETNKKYLAKHFPID